MPKDMDNQFICEKCVMDKTDPDIKFKDGMCNYCLDYKAKENNRRAEKTNLQWIYHNLRRKGGYDCLLGLSGGVDSSLCLHYLIENGIKPLTFSVDNGWNTPESDENVAKLVKKTRVPFYNFYCEGGINKDKFRELQMAFIKSGTKNIEIPTDHILMAVTYELARKHGIKYVVGGGNYQTESIMPKAWGYQAKDLTHIKSIYKRFTGKRLTGLPTISLPQYLKYRFINGIKVINLLDYYDYNREKAIDLLKEKYDYKPYGEKHCESVFTWWFQSYYLPKKFNIDKRKPHYSSMIQSGQMTRSEALELLKKSPEYPEIGLERFALKYEKKSYKDYPNSERAWNLLSRVYRYAKRT